VTHLPPVPGRPGRPGRLSATVTRDLPVPIAAVRQALLASLRQSGLSVTLDQLSAIVAERGSRLSGLTMTPERVPLAVRADIAPAPGGCRVVLRVEDAWAVGIGRSWGAVGAYRTAFEMLTAAIDRSLAAVAPGAPAEPWHLDLGSDAAGFQGVSGMAQRAQRSLGRRSDRGVAGAAGASSRQVAASGLRQVELVSPSGVARLDAEVVDAMLTTGRLVVDRPGSLPPPLLADVQRFVILLEEHLERAGGAAYVAPVSRMEVQPGHVPVVAFLFQQARLREQLPLRLLLVCTTCRLEKVVNPDLAQLRERARRTAALTSSVGLLAGASPYMMLGRMAHSRSNEPDYVCPRCQGLDADQCVVTFCPQCGERRDESALRTCQRCQYDFRALDRTTPDWQPHATAVPPPPPPPPLGYSATRPPRPPG
jgi:hypothetical protein